MRGHLLKHLPVPGRETALSVFPDFDFYDLDHVKRLVFESDGLDSSVDLVITATYKTMSGVEGEITLHFGGVTYAKLPELAPLFLLTEVEVEDVSDSQIEGVKYRTASFGMNNFEILSRHLKVKGFNVY